MRCDRVRCASKFLVLPKNAVTMALRPSCVMDSVDHRVNAVETQLEDEKGGQEL